MKQEKLTVIKPKSGFFKLNFKEIWEYRDLIGLFAKRNLSVKYKQTILGPLWLIITPLISTVISSFVFGGIVKIDSGEAPYFAFYFTAFIAWSFFASCLTSTATTFASNAGIFRKVFFPRLVVPLSAILTTLFRFAVHFVLAVIILLIFSLRGAAIAPVWSMIWLLPLLLLEMAALALGCGTILSSLTAKFRDLSKLVGLGVDAWKYLTPVIYAAKSVPQAFHFLVLINPMAPIIEAFRFIMLGTGGAIHPRSLILSLAVTLVILLFGLLLFHRTERTFIDTV